MILFFGVKNFKDFEELIELRNQNNQLKNQLIVTTKDKKSTSIKETDIVFIKSNIEKKINKRNKKYIKDINVNNMLKTENNENLYHVILHFDRSKINTANKMKIFLALIYNIEEVRKIIVVDVDFIEIIYNLKKGNK
jgi:hypothetical protein